MKDAYRLSAFSRRGIYLRCQSGRYTDTYYLVTGTLKGYDQLMNLVMDDVVEEFESESLTPTAELWLLGCVHPPVLSIG